LETNRKETVMDQLGTMLIATQVARDVGRTCRYEAPAGNTLGWVRRWLRRLAWSAVPSVTADRGAL
jgi:hypothetical protein